eukprot:gene1129-12717_t
MVSEGELYQAGDAKRGTAARAGMCSEVKAVATDGAATGGAGTPTDQSDPAGPDIDPAGPDIDPDIDPAGPDIDPSGPDIDPAGPDIDPAGPDIDPAGPDIDPAGPDIDPAGPDIDPYIDPAGPDRSADGAAIIRYDRALSRENTLSLASVIMEYTNTMDPPPAYDIAKRNCDIFAASCRLGRKSRSITEQRGGACIMVPKSA